VAAPVTVGDPITLQIKIDDNQRLQIRLAVHADGEVQRFDVDLDNPFSVTANPNADRDRILQLEEEIPQANGAKQRALLIELAQLHHRLKEYERARQLLEGLLVTATGSEAGWLLVQLGLICGQMNDTEAQIDYYKEAMRHGDTSVAGFNLALALRESQPAEALEIIDVVVQVRGSGPDFSLRGSILSRLARSEEAAESWRASVARMQDLPNLNDFELGWLRNAAVGLGDQALIGAIDAERQRRRQVGVAEDERGAPGAGAALPDWQR
jgi:tetratricopeptide (TPR) repeat protein